MPYREDDVSIGAGATIERTAVLKVAGLAESVVVEGAGTRIDVRNPGFGTRFGSEDIDAIPTRRASMYDFVRASPGVSPTSPSSGVATTISAFGSGTNENQFLIDGMNTTCPCSGVARTEPGLDFIHEVQVTAVGTSAEFGNMQGAVINVVTKQGGERFLYDGSYYGQASALTSQPVSLRYLGSGEQHSGYERAKYADFTNSLGGPAIRDRLWFFAGYQSLRDYDSQPGTDPTLPRTYEMQRFFGKLTWRLAPGWQLVQSFHDEIGIDPERPTIVTPFEATARTHISAPTMNFGDLTHTMSANTLWDIRVGRFVSHRSGDQNARESDNAKPVRPCHRRHHRRETERRSRRPLSYDCQGDPHALPARPGRRTPVESRRTIRTRRAPRDQLHSNRCQVRRQGWAAVSVHLESSLQHRRCRPDLLRLRDRHDDDAQPADDHRRRAVRPQPCDQSGSARGRCEPARDRRSHRRPRNDVHLEPVVATAGCHDKAERRRSYDAEGELRTVLPRCLHRRVGALSPGCDRGDDDRFQFHCRRLFGPGDHGRSQGQFAVGSRDCVRREPTSTPSASIAQSALG